MPNGLEMLVLVKPVASTGMTSFCAYVALGRTCKTLLHARFVEIDDNDEPGEVHPGQGYETSLKGFRKCLELRWNTFTKSILYSESLSPETLFDLPF